MTFTPYTTDALTRIKNGATPSDLGWAEPFYRSICRKHGIAPNILRQPSVPIEPTTPPLAPELSCAQASQPKRRTRQRSSIRVRGHNVAVSEDMQMRVLLASEAEDQSYSNIIRAAMQAAVDSTSTLPPWRSKGDVASAQMAVTLTTDELERFSVVARQRGLILQEFIRRAIAAHVPAVLR